GLTPEQFRAAIGIAASFSAGLFEFVNDGSLVKRLHPGHAVKSGILAAELAGHGYSGPVQALDGSLGFFNAFAGKPRLDPIVRELGETFEIERTSYKRHACCSYGHPLMDALLLLREKTRIDADRVEEVVGRTFSEAVRLLGEPLARKRAPL